MCYKETGNLETSKNSKLFFFNKPEELFFSLFFACKGRN